MSDNSSPDMLKGYHMAKLTNIEVDEEDIYAVFIPAGT